MANRFWVGPAGNYNSTNWSTTTGGGSGSLAPTASDDVKFDGAGANGNTNCTITAAAVALSVVFSSGYTATITINATFTLTISGLFTDHANHTWTVNSTAAGALTINATSTITSGGKTFPGNVTLSGLNTKTLSGDWTITGTLTPASGAVTINKTTAEVLSCAGFAQGTSVLGTINITLTGGTWSGASANGITGIWNFAGNVTVSGALSWGGGTLKYTSGSITTTGSTLSISATASTFDTNGITWNNVSLAGIITHTINSLLSGGTLAFTTAITFAGTSGWTFNTVNITSVAATVITLKNSVVYTINTAFNCGLASSATHPSFTSDDGTIKAILILPYTATCFLRADFTRIDASGGRPILTFNGTVTTCTNVFSYNDVQVQPPRNARKIGRRAPIYNRAKTVQYL